MTHLLSTWTRLIAVMAVVVALGTVALASGPVVNASNHQGSLVVFPYSASSGAPMPGVAVTLNTGQTVTTNNSGQAVFTPLANGVYSISASIPGAGTGTVNALVENSTTLVAVAMVPLGSPVPQPFPALRPTVSTVIRLNPAGNVIGNRATTTVVLTNVASATVQNAELSIQADGQFPIADCWAGAPGRNGCVQPGNNDAQWWVGDVPPGVSRGPYTVDYTTSVLPSLSTATVEVVSVRYGIGNQAPVTFNVALGENPDGFPGIANSWLDVPNPANWNRPGASVPLAPPNPSQNPQCASQVRSAGSPADAALVSRGWLLWGTPTSNGTTTIISAGTGWDGMCRPMGFNYFVFTGNVFAGTLSPTLMDSRTDGQLSTVDIRNQANWSANYARYSPTDPLCCPSRTTNVTFQLQNLGGSMTTVPIQTRTTTNP